MEKPPNRSRHPNSRPSTRRLQILRQSRYTHSRTVSRKRRIKRRSVLRQIRQPIYHDQAHQTTEPPFAAGSASYHTYQEWQAQENKRQAKKPQAAVQKAVHHCWQRCGCNCTVLRRPVLRQQPAGSTNSSSASSSNQNLPTLTISSTPKDGSSSSSADGVLSGEEIYQKLNDSIVAIQSADESGQVASSGSGVVMSEDGYNITNAHVIADENTGEPMSNISVLFADGSQLTASVVGSDDQTDLAVLKVEPTSTLTPAEFGDSDQLQVGEDAYAIGSPGGVQLANSMTSGIISAINRDITVNDRVMSLIQTNVTINPGNSGGALINKYGQVVGITSAKLGISYYEGLGFAIPINSAKEIVDELIQNGYISAVRRSALPAATSANRWHSTAICRRASKLLRSIRVPMLRPRACRLVT